MKAALALSALCLGVSSCTPPTVTSLPQMELVSAFRDGDKVSVTLCYEQPEGQNWIPGRHADDASISVAGSSYPMSSLDFIGFRASPAGIATHRCDRLAFLIPMQPQEAQYSLTIRNLVGDTPTAADCPTAQERLESGNTGIKIECLEDSEGQFSFGLLDHPAEMTDLEASYAVDDLAGEVLHGPWEFTFTVATLGE